MNVTLSPEDEALIQEKLQSGQFLDRKSVVSHALHLLRGTGASLNRQLSAEERARGLEEFFAEVDRDPPSEAGPLSDESLSPAGLNDTEGTRV